MKSKITKVTQSLKLIICVAAVLLFVQSVSAQETRGVIRGTVTDPNNSPVPGASVKIIDPTRGTTLDLKTNDDGFFQATYLFPGTYQIVVETTGFKKSVRDNVLLEIGSAIQVDMPLEVGGSQETVTVTADIPPLNTESASLGQTIDAQRIAELPLVHGDPYTLINLSPGVTYTGSARLDRPFEPTHIVGFAVDGTRGNRSDLTIDGAPSTATANANEVIATYVPPSDIVQEFKVQTATFDAQFGNTEGGVTSISIKSGTNSLHGSAYYFAEPGTWAANDFFGNSRGTARPETKSNRFGGYVSGPVRIPWLFNGKDKTFFLFGFEGIRDSRPRFDAAAGSYVPNAAIASGDFSAFLPANCVAPLCSPVIIYDPLTRVNTGTASSPIYTAQPFAGNIIPIGRINSISKAVLSYFAKPKQSGLVGNIFDSTLSETTQPYNNFTFRIDQNISNNNHLFVRGSYYDRNSLYNRYTDSPYTGVNFLFKARQGVIDDVHTFDSTTFLNVRYGYNRFIRGQDQQADAQGFDLTQLGFSSAFNNSIPETLRRFPRFDFTGGPLGNGMSNEFRPVDTHSVAAILNKTIGTHSLKFGSELRIYREDDAFASNDQTGQFSFDNLYTKQASNTTAADVNGLQGLAAFLLGLPTTQQIVRRTDYSEYSKTYGFFAQDDWKINRKLTLNLGLRYEVETPLVERQNKSVSGFDVNYSQPIGATVRQRLTTTPVTGYDGQPINPSNFNINGGLLFAGKDTGSGLYTTPKTNFLPRFGVAYQLNDKTVIRGGFGLFAGFLGERRGDVIQPGYTRSTLLGTTTLASGAPVPQSISNFSNITVLEPVGSAQGKQTGLGTPISFFNQNPKSSKQARFQIGFQRQLPGGYVLEAVYVGNRGYNIEIVRNINALPVQYLNTDNSRTAAQVINNTLLTTLVTNPFAGLPEFAGTNFANPTIARSQLLRPFPLYGDILTTNNDGKSWYHSGQFSLQKRFSQGYTLQASYTWSKWLTATEYLNAGDPKPTKMISDQDSPHRFSMSGIYALPFGKGKQFLSSANGLVDRIVNGWQLQAVYAFQIGFPIAFGAYNATTAATSGDIFYNGGDISIDPKNRTTAKWFNTDVFSLVTPSNHLRTLPFRFTDVRRDNINNFDFSVLKDVRVRENMKIQIRFELINALNEPYFPAPSTTATNFGQIAVSNQDNYARRAQFGLKFIF
jgi:Carboxypeptidase regulatory-like domain